MSGDHEKAEQLLTRLEEQCGLYVELRNLAQRQRQLITSENTEGLLELLGERNRIVSRLASLTQQLGPLQDYCRTRPELLSDGEREEAQALLNRIHEHLRCVLDIDGEDGRLLAARKEHTAEQMQSLVTNQQAFRAYGAAHRRPATAALRTDESV